MGPLQQCGVCQGAAAKYKCPLCILPYCSIACFKSHKANPCSKPEQPQQEEAEQQQQAQPPRDFERDEEDTQVSNRRLKRAQLEAVASSQQVRDMLKDEDLCRSIKSIDASENAAGDFDAAMQSPAFKALADKLLEIINGSV